MEVEDKKPDYKYDNKLKNELRAACDAGGLDKLIYSFSRYIIKHDEKERDELVKNTILSGNIYSLPSVYKVLGSGDASAGEREFNESIERFQKNKEGSPLAFALLSNDRDMINKISFILSSDSKIGNVALRVQAQKYIDSGGSEKDLHPSPEIDGINKVDTVARALQIAALAGAEFNKEHFIRISIAKNKLRELLQDGDYYLVGESIKDIGHIQSHYDYGADEQPHDRAKEWARALNIAGIKAEELKQKINLPESVERFMTRLDDRGVAKKPSDDRKPFAPSII